MVQRISAGDEGEGLRGATEGGGHSDIILHAISQPPSPTLNTFHSSVESLYVKIAMVAYSVFLISCLLCFFRVSYL